ncbi:MAG: sortase [Hominenteromicrobium sp.]
MKSKRGIIGIICMFLGAALVLGALSLFVHNQREAAEAEKTAAGVMEQLVQAVDAQRAQAAEDPASAPVCPDPTDTSMPEVIIDGRAYIGYVTLPTLGMELPVLSACSEEALRIAPCRYAGTVLDGNLVIAGHNYVSHFGPISGLSVGDTVLFTGADGAIYRYSVAETDILPATAVEDMTAGEFDLTLFTCTYSGQERIAVRCMRVQNE